VNGDKKMPGNECGKSAIPDGNPKKNTHKHTRNAGEKNQTLKQDAQKGHLVSFVVTDNMKEGHRNRYGGGKKKGPAVVIVYFRAVV
jgi:hypothetical protein